MADGHGKLSTTRIRKLTKPGRYGDGLRLYIQVQTWELEGKTYNTKSWLFVFRSPVTGRMRQFGLGGWPDVPLEEARERASAASALVRAGKDPIDEQREKDRQKRIADAATEGVNQTFKRVAERYIAENEAAWKNAKHKEQWRTTLATYAYPAIGHLAIGAIDTTTIVDKILKPLWTTKTETAKRLRGRIKTVFDFAKAHGWRTGENPAAWDGHIALILPKPSRITSVRRQPSLPYSEIPSFMAELRERDSVSARALEFTVLTAARTGAVIGAPWSEFNTEKQLWTVPPGRLGTKMQLSEPEPRLVPLVGRSLEIIKGMRRVAGNRFVFIGAANGQHLSNMAMLELLRGMYDGVAVHGFRATFKNWVREQTNHQDWVSEAALWHVIRDKAAAAYIRPNAVEKQRLALMTDWDAYCMSGVVAKVRDAA